MIDLKKVNPGDIIFYDGGKGGPARHAVVHSVVFNSLGVPHRLEVKILDSEYMDGYETWGTWEHVYSAYLEQGVL